MAHDVEPLETLRPTFYVDAQRNRRSIPGRGMTKLWAAWLAFLVLATVVTVTSCQALFAPDAPALEQTQ
jgi:hypothetical protein